MPPRMIHELERIRYRKGQALASRDLRDEQDFEGMLRWNHNRSLHHAWGIAIGLEVTNQGGRAVRVSPGIAYDGYGRELLLSRPVEIDFPELKVNQASDLVIRYKESAEFPRRSDMQATCLPQESEDSGKVSFSALEEQPAFLWRKAGTARLGEEIPLIRVQPGANEASLELDRSVRRSAQALSRPHIGHGEVLVDLKSMIPWIEVIENRQLLMGLQFEVDTSPAGFDRTPCYVHIAQIQLRLRQNVVTFPVPYFESIAAPQPDRFTYRIMVFSTFGTRLSARGLQPLTAEPGVPGLAAEMASSFFGAQPAQAEGETLPVKISIAWLGIDHGFETGTLSTPAGWNGENQ